LNARAGGHDDGGLSAALIEGFFDAHGSPEHDQSKKRPACWGLGMSTSGTLAAVADRVFDAEETWLDRARDAARETDNFVKGNSWAALAVMAAVSFAAGFYLSRRR